MSQLAPPRIQAGASRQAELGSRGPGWGKHSFYPIYGIVACLALAGAARLIELVPFPLPLCGFRALTGLPCAFCGSTRSFMAWSHLEIAQAFRYNPLVASGC